MAAFLGGDIPPESRATCHSCAMLPAPGQVPGPRHFDAVTKCCTYVPKLANFRVGDILADRDPAAAAGRATLVARIAAGIGVSPLGLARPPAWELVYRHGVTPSDHAFGRTRTLRCPHYLEDGRCGIWRHREAVCATWFCKHDRGGVGQAFWEALGQLLGVLERALARRCVLALDVGDVALAAVLDEGQPDDGPSLDGRADAARQQRIWGTWHGREHTFYEACAAHVETLGWDDVWRAGGAEAEAHGQVVRATYDALVWEAIPARLRLARLAGVELGPVLARVETYRSYDPLGVPTELLPHLARFDGRPTADVRDELAAAGVTLPAAMLQQLVDWGVLVRG
jgi:hypothetical protein